VKSRMLLSDNVRNCGYLGCIEKQEAFVLSYRQEKEIENMKDLMLEFFDFSQDNLNVSISKTYIF
jgi:hypothetical protein